MYSPGKSAAFAGLAAAMAYLFVGPAAAQPERVKVLIGFAQRPGPAEQALVRAAGGTIKYTYHLVPAIAATVPQAAIDGLQRNPHVTRVEPDVEVHIVDAELVNTWGVQHIGAGKAHDGGNLGTGVKVAVLDTGIDYTHPDLDGNYMGGWDFVNNDDDPMDDHRHGTHVSGTVAAENDDTGVVGVAPEAYLYALKVLDANGSGFFSDIISALQWCVDNDIQVTNNSYGSRGDPGATVADAFYNSAAKVVHVAAAGNSGRRNGKGNNVSYPARYNSVVAVAATDQNDKRASFSSTGPTVELAAPGVGVNSTQLGGGYVEFNGTSMASPHVAGTAALIRADWTLSVADVRARLQLTADDLGDAGKDNQYGYGLVDAEEAGDLGLSNYPPTVSITSPADPNLSFDSGALVTFQGTASDTEDVGDLSGSIVWTAGNQQLGTGAEVSASFADGEHTITAWVTDSGSKTGSDSVTITLGSPPAGPALYLVVTTDKQSYSNRENVLIDVMVLDGDTLFSELIDGAAVHIDLITANGAKLTGDNTTNIIGIASFRYKVNSKRHGVGDYRIDATATKTGYEPGSGSTTIQVK